MNKPFTPLKNNQLGKVTAPISPVAGNGATMIWKTILITLLMLSLLLGYNTSFAQTYCTMVCNDNLNFSVGNECSVTVRYDQILEDGDNSYTCTPNGWQAFKIDVMDEAGKVLPTSPTIPYEYVGRTLTVKVKHWATGNNCWATINLVDKIPPRLNCPPDVSIPCTQSTEPDVTGWATINDCSSGSNVTYEDIYNDLDCGNPIGKLTRIWTAIDVHGNKSQCSQTISIVRPTTTSVSFPPNLDGISNPAISCMQVGTNADRTQPIYTGYPTINGKPITGISSNVCKINANYEDQIIDACSGTYKILRKWTILNWCTSEIRTGNQIIKVEDDTPPTLTVPADLTVGTQTIDCFTNVPLLPATVTDACSDEISVKITSAFNTIHANGGVLLNVPIGTHTIVYEATDACNNTISQPMRLTVVDDDPPTVICNDETVVSLSSDGTATVYASSFDDGSYDNCCLDKLLVRRMGDEHFGLSVKFDCVDDEVMVELQATDCHGNKNSCMVNVTIQDKVAPTIVCPADQTIDCEADYSDLSQFGQAQVADNCGYDIVESVVQDLDNCGTGTIQRTWTAMGSSGGVATCTQTITILNATPWNSTNNQINWPKDYETAACISATSLHPEDLPVGFNEPTFLGDNGCALVATNYTDLVLDIEPPACFKILRTWTIIDWCQYEVNANNGKGRWEYEQVIKVTDTTKPTFGIEPTDFTVDMLDGGCGGTVTIPNVGVSDCSPNATVTAQGALGNGFGPFNNVMPGVYDMKYIATDGCGNTIAKDVKITVRDAVKPTPICVDGLKVTLNNSNPPSVEVWATDLNAKSFDNCTPDQNLDFRIRKYDPNLTTAPGATNVTFTCDELGTQQVEVWAVDAQGNADYCLTTIEIQDNSKLCGGGYTSEGQIALAGKITTAAGSPVSEVNVQLTHPDKAPYVTGKDGQFVYEQLPSNFDYALIPEKNSAPKNGVTTLDIIKIRKHMIASEVFDSPYKYIAADVDQSGSITTMDLIQARKLILGLIDEFPNNESWRFVPTAHQFEAGANPLQTTFPEIAVIPASSEDKKHVDFMAIKVGDIDNSAQATNYTQADSRSQTKSLVFDIENQSFKAGEIVNVTLKANQFKAILGCQFELNFDKTIMDYQTFKKAAIDNFSVDNLGLAQIAKGKIKVSWEDIKGLTLQDGKGLVTFQFTAKKAGQLNELITLNKKELTAEAYNTQEEIYDIQFKFNQSAQPTHTVKLLQNQPNPFYDETAIQFSLANSQTIQFTVFDVNGKVLKQITGNYAKGLHTLTIKRTDLPTTGILYYALETKTDRLIRKMILLNK